jgi:Flp pilus assembly protein TadG
MEKRRRQRGAAMVESAVVAAFMVILLACMWAAVRFQSAKIAVMNETRVAAWQAALQPCEGTESTLDNIAQATDDSSSGPLPSTANVDPYLSVGASSLATDSGYVDVTRKRLVAFPGLLGGKVYEMKSSMTMRCNEPTPPENAEDLFLTALGVAKYLQNF